MVYYRFTNRKDSRTLHLWLCPCRKKQLLFCRPNGYPSPWSSRSGMPSDSYSWHPDPFVTGSPWQPQVYRTNHRVYVTFQGILKITHKYSIILSTQKIQKSCNLTVLVSPWHILQKKKTPVVVIVISEKMIVHSHLPSRCISQWRGRIGYTNSFTLS